MDFFNLDSTNSNLTLDNISRPTSKTITAVLTVVLFFTAIAYGVGIFVLCRSAKRSISLNSALAIRRQLYTTAVFVLLIFFSLLESATAVWLIAQYIHTRVFPNVGARDGVRISLFAASWTLITSTILLLLFLHPKYTNHPLSSVRTHAAWIILTWSFWVACVATLSRALPVAHCAGSAYCMQFRSAFALGMIETIIFTLSMLAILLLVYIDARHRKAQIPRKF